MGRALVSTFRKDCVLLCGIPLTLFPHLGAEPLGHCLGIRPHPILILLLFCPFLTFLAFIESEPGLAALFYGTVLLCLRRPS